LRAVGGNPSHSAPEAMGAEALWASPRILQCI
jgi:hypothetical protein